MIRNPPRPLPWLPALGRGVLTLGAAVLAGLTLVQLLLAPPRSEMWTLALYLVASGTATMILGVVAVRIFDRAGVLTLRAKITLGAIVGALVGLISVFIVARLMFVSTAHDLRLLAALIAFSSLVSLAFSGWVGSRVAADIAAITQRIAGLAAGDYETRLVPAGRDEVAVVAEQLNRLAALLADAAATRSSVERERRDFTVAISHDLRTPLASVRAMAEALADGVVEEPTEMHRYHVATRREVERLTRMVDDLFALAQLDSGALALERRPIALSEIAAEVVDAVQARATAAGVAVLLSVDAAPPPIMLDGALIERAIANLVANAIEHTPVGGRIAVSVGVSAARQQVTVADTGVGIAPHDIEHVWERFFRAERSRGRAAGQAEGAGLGLAIVKGIVEAHGGAVSVASATGAGATFVIALPT